MRSSDWSAIAHCAEQRMDLLWEQACAAPTVKAALLLNERRWREWETYMACQAQARYLWSLRP